jgi:hypothetical protein
MNRKNLLLSIVAMFTIVVAVYADHDPNGVFTPHNSRTSVLRHRFGASPTQAQINGAIAAYQKLGYTHAYTFKGSETMYVIDGVNPDTGKPLHDYHGHKVAPGARAYFKDDKLSCFFVGCVSIR